MSVFFKNSPYFLSMKVDKQTNEMPQAHKKIATEFVKKDAEELVATKEQDNVSSKKPSKKNKK